MTPAAVGEWNIVGVLGEGTYGRVARARKRRAGGDTGDVALKMSKLDGDGLPCTFVRELAVLAALPPHAAVVPLLDSVLSDVQHPSIVLGLASATLSEAVRAAWHVGHVELLSRQLFEALAHLEQHGVVHRDIKPDNILLDDAGAEPKLMIADFGLARFLGEGRCLTLEVVTLWYRAPEVLLGDVHYGHSVDVFSAGATVAYMLDERHIFVAESEMEMLLKVFETLGTPPAGGALRRLPLWEDDKIPCFGGRQDELAARWTGKTRIPLLQTLATDPACRPTARSVVDRLVEATTSPEAAPVGS
jgi:serine/threonine protein kinase